MRCCFVYKEDYPWDVRVEKITDSLSEAGHNVVLVCRNIEQRDTTEQLGKVAIRRLPITSSFPPLLQRLLNLPLWFNPVWVWAVMSAVRRQQSDVIIVRDLPLVLLGVIIGKAFGARVIFDMAECYPEMYASTLQFAHNSSWQRLISKNPTLTAWYERVAVRLSDHVFVMIEESRSRLLSRGVDDGKITIVSNTPKLPTPPIRTMVDHHGGGLRLIYVGFLTRIRGLDVAIRAFSRYLATMDPESRCLNRFDLIGVGAATSELTELVRALELEDVVHIHGWLQSGEVAVLMDQANVGVLTYRVCGHWNHTIPNKLFDYMLRGIPVLGTPVIPIQRIILNCDCGVVGADQDDQSVADQLHKLRDASLRTRLGSNGKRAVLDDMNWQTDERRMLAAIVAASADGAA